MEGRKKLRGGFGVYGVGLAHPDPPAAGHPSQEGNVG